MNSSQPSDRPTRVLIVDDHDFFRAGLRGILVEQGFEVVGEATSGDGVVGLVERRSPDVVLMDLSMPGVSGIEATRQLTEAGMTVPVVVLTISSVEEDVVDALEAGAAGYLLKHSTPDEIVRSLIAAMAGDAPLSPGIARHLVARSRQHPGRMEAASRVRGALTDREVEVLRLIADGLDNSQIAGRLHVSSATVKRDVSAVLEKLGVSNRMQAAIQGVRAGLV